MMRMVISGFVRGVAVVALIGGSAALADPRPAPIGGVGDHAQAVAVDDSLIAIGRPLLDRVEGVPLLNGPDVGDVKRWHMAALDQDAIFDRGELARQAAGEPVTLDLRGDGRPVALRRVAIDLATGDTETWYGEVVGHPEGYALFVRHKGVVAGKAMLPGVGLFEILDGGDGLFIVRELNEEAMPPCGNTHAHRIIDPAQGQLHEADGESELTTPDRGAFIFVDVLIVYTLKARLDAGSVANMEAQLNLALADANLAYAASGITMRIRFPAMVETPYVQSTTLQIDLANLRSLGDGHIDEAHSLRSTYSADMVALITAAASGGACGVGYLMTFVSPTFSTNAFSVTARTCLSGQTLTHELGHNQGCAHDRANAGGPGAFSYSFGHRDGGNAYRSVMAYAPGQRTKLFSNPNVNFPNGQPSGVPIESPTSAHNAMSLELAAPTVAAWRTLYTSAPGNFNLLTPATGVTTESRNITLTWSEAPDTDYYRVEVDDNPNFTNPEIAAEPITTTSYTTPHNALNLGETYYWKVLAVNPLGQATSTPAIRSFHTPAIAPSAFTLTLPAPETTGISTKAAFKWAASDNTDTYTIIVDDNADFSSPHINVSGLSNANYSAASNPLLPQTEYFWKVIAVNTYGSTTSSPMTSSFTTVGLPPLDFALVSPPDGPNVTTSGPTLTWTASEFADVYEVIVDDSPSLNTPEYHVTDLTETTHQIPVGALASGIRYYWRVISSNGVGSVTCSPATFSFGVLVPFCSGDADRSAIVNFDDISSVLSNWGGAGPMGDANNSGFVDFADISSVLANWGTECPQ